MSELVKSDFVDPRQTALVLEEVYQAALQVEARFPDRHIASIAARKIIAVFSSEIPRRQNVGRRIAPAMIGTA